MSLLAVNPIIESIRAAMHAGMDTADLVIVGCCAAAVLLVLVLAARSSIRAEAPRAAPKVDYLTLLVDLLDLSEEDRRDLKRIAAVVGLEHPGAILLTPANLAHAVHHPRLGRQQQELIQRMDLLSRRLFDCPLPRP